MMINYISVGIANLAAVLFLLAISASLEKDEESSLDDACHWINDRTCPDPEVRFYLYTRLNVDEQQLIHIDDTLDASNLSSSFFNPQQPSKIIIHGYRADMFLTPLFEMKTGKSRNDAVSVDSVVIVNKALLIIRISATGFV